MCTINENHMIYDSWNIRCDWQKYLSFWAIFCPVSPPGNLENQNFKIEKNSIILHIWTINDNHMMYDSWDIDPDRQNFLLFWTVLCLFSPLLTWKIIFFKIGIHSMQGWTATTRHGVTRKRNTKILRHTWNLFRKNLQLKDDC